VKLTTESIIDHDETRWAGVREVVLMALPIILMVGSNTLMNAADSWMVGQLSKKHLAAIMPAGLLNHVVVSFFIGVVSCVSTFVGQSYGRRELRNCSHYAWQGVHVSLMVSAGVMLLHPLTPHIFGLLGHSPGVQALEATYFRIRLWGVGGAVMTVALASFFYATSRPVVPLAATVVANALNFVGDYALIFGKLGMPQMGIRGAAIATNVATWFCTLALLAVFLAGPYHQTFASRSTWRWDVSKVRQLFKVGWPAGLSMGMDASSWVIFTAIIIGHFGVDALAASTATGQILSGSFMPTIALGMATTALVGQWIGRRDLARATRRYLTALKLGVGYMTLMGLIFVLFGHRLIAFFRPEPEVVTLGAKFLLFAAAFQFFDAATIVTGSALKGAGDTRWTMVVHLIIAWGLFLPISYVLAFRTHLGPIGAWLGAVVYIWVLGIAFLWRFFSGKWKTIDIFEKAQERPPVSIEPPLPTGDRLPSEAAGLPVTSITGSPRPETASEPAGSPHELADDPEPGASGT